MKYRSLSEEELAPLRSDFVQFLAANGIAGPDWQVMISQDQEQAKVWIQQFSQVVWEKVLPKVKALELRKEDQWICIGTMKDHAEMIKLELSDTDQLNFEDPELINKLEQGGAGLLNKAGATIYKGNKGWGGVREEGIYALMNQGFQPCHEIVFINLNKLVKDN